MESGRGLLLLFEQGQLKVYIMKGNKRTNLIMICRSLSRKGDFESHEEFFNYEERVDDFFKAS